MSLPAKEIKKLILESIPDASVEITDLRGDDNHFSAVVKSKIFKNLNKIEQHKLVYKSLKGKMGNELHALSITSRLHNGNKTKIEDLLKQNNICLFMKGTPDAPQCGFSMAVSNVLKHLKVNFKAVNILEDENLRQGIKEYSDWPTIPQLYINKEFIGGCDIVKEMFEKGELKNFLKIKN